MAAMVVGHVRLLPFYSCRLYRISFIESFPHRHLTFLRPLRTGRERGGQLLIEAEKILYPLTLAGKWSLAVAGIHGAVEVLVSLGQRGGHG